jgi:hypothetical protein
MLISFMNTENSLCHNCHSLYYPLLHVCILGLNLYFNLTRDYLKTIANIFNLSSVNIGQFNNNLVMVNTEHQAI